MICIDGHTLDETLLAGGWVIDAGCRGFKFSEHFLQSRQSSTNVPGIFCIDIEDFTASQYYRGHEIPSFTLKQAALTNFTGETECYLFGNGTANFIKGINQEPGSMEYRPVQKITVPAITLQDIYKEIGTDIDLLKLDIEGAEYLVLKDFDPIPRQITVEMHEHVHPELHKQHFDEVFEGLCKHYNATLFIREWPRYKYMDCLFTRKDLI